MQSINKKLGLLVAGAICALMLMAVRSHGEGNDYKLGSDDSIATTVFDHPELSVALRVSKSGNITFPLLGVVSVSGLSTREVEELLVRKLSEGGFVRQPQVSVTVTDYQSQKVAVMGLVTRPGQYALTTSNKVLDLLAQAGGLVNGATAGAANGVAGDDAILVHRDGTKVKLDLNAMFEGDPTQNPPVSGGDTVFVPRAPVFYIYGQVQRSGSYKLERDMTVDQAISAGGGLTLKGSEHRIIVKRRDAKGKTRDISVRGRDLVQPDDVINVREGWF
jgi:polysaccharide export outer membrane protein